MKDWLIYICGCLAIVVTGMVFVEGCDDEVKSPQQVELNKQKSFTDQRQAVVAHQLMEMSATLSKES